MQDGVIDATYKDGASHGLSVFVRVNGTTVSLFKNGKEVSSFAFDTEF